MKTLQNQDLTIQVSSHGAELCSIRCGEKEYLWQANPKYWARHSPVLFPIVGKVWENTYRVDGVAYSLSQHGFARDMDFELILDTEEEVRYRLQSNEETLQKYPFPFVLEIGYRLEGKRVEVLWEVKNTGDKEMHFQIGAHPAFVYQDFDASSEQRGFFAFDRKDKLHYIGPKEKGCVSADLHELELDDEGLMPINTHTFDCDTYVFENGQLSRVTLLDKEKSPCVSMMFSTPLVALWSPTIAHPDCPFVCIEPWYGRADSVGYTGELKDRDWMQHLAAGEVFKGSYVIEVF